MNEISERSQIHATFVIERDLDAPLDRVWHALSDNDARDQWFGGGPTFDIHAKSHAFRVGGGAVGRDSGTAARDRGSSPPTPTSSSSSGSSSPTTCGSMASTCRRLSPRSPSKQTATAPA